MVMSMLGCEPPCDTHYLYIGIPRAVTASIIMNLAYSAHVSAHIIEMFGVFMVVHIKYYRYLRNKIYDILS